MAADAAAAGALATGGVVAGAGGCSGVSAQATIKPRIAAGQALRARRRKLDMWVIVLEALLALALLLLIVWWTMFLGRRNGERADRDE